MLELIYGLSGSGKTYMITEKIKQDLNDTDCNIYLIVPEQLVLTSERKMLALLPSSAQLRVNVISFSRLANLVFRKFGGLSYNYINSGVKALMTWLAVKEASTSFREYDINIASDSAFPKLMRSVISEFKASCITPDDLCNALGKLNSQDRTKNKLFDIASVYSIYESMISEKYDDASDDLTKLAEILQKNDFFGGCRVYLDAFKGFTAQEFRIIAALFRQSDCVCVSLCADKPRSRMPHFATAVETAFKLKVLAAETIGSDNIKEILLKEIKRTSSDELTLLNSDLWRYELNAEDTNDIKSDRRGDIELYTCDTPYSEAEMIGNYILRAVQRGYRYRDIAVIYRNAKERSGVIDTVFEKFGIPYFMSVKSDISSKPAVKLIMSALRIKIYNYSQQDVMSFIKTGLAGVDPMDSDIFEDYITTWNIRGSGYSSEWKMNPDGYIKDLTDRSKKILSVAEKVRKNIYGILSTFCRMLDEAQTANDITYSIYDLLKKLNVAEKLTKLSERESELGFGKDADETLQVYNILITALADINNAVGERNIDTADYFSVLKMILDDTEIGTIPTSADQVTVGSADLLRLDGIKLAFVAGAVEGEFPQNVLESPVLTEDDRKKLKLIGIELADTEGSSSDELFFAYSALTVASEKLIVSFPMANTAGKALIRSSIVNRILLLFGYLNIINYDRLPPSERFFSPRSAFEYLSTGAEAESIPLRMSLEGLSEYKASLPLLDVKISDPTETLSEDTVRMLFGKKIRLTQTKLENYVKCRMSYYCKYILKLRSHSRAAFGGNDIGTLVHDVLENVIRYLSDKHKLKGENVLSDAELDGIVEMSAAEFVSMSYPDDIHRSNRLRHFISKLSRLSNIIIRQIIAEFKNSDFVPEFFELAINQNSEYGLTPYEIILNTGEKVSISGTADRVDIYRSGKDIFVRVVDYKTGSKSFSLKDISKGTNLQALLYLYAICNCSNPVWKEQIGADDDSSVIPSAAVYLSTNISPIESQDPLTNVDMVEEALKDTKYRGVMTDRDDILRAASHTLSYKVIPGKLNGRNQKENKSLLSDEQFDEVFKQVEYVITEISRDILKGKISSTGFCMSDDVIPDKTSCQYCEFSSVCRIDRDGLKDINKK